MSDSGAACTNDAYLALGSLVKIARAVLPSGDLALGALGLDRGPLLRSRAALLDAGRRFLNALDTDVALASRLGTYGVTPTKRAAAKAALSALESAQTVQTTAKGAAEDAAPTARESLDALNNWVMQYRNIARIALTGNPQLLEKLGIGIAS